MSTPESEINTAEELQHATDNLDSTLAMDLRLTKNKEEASVMDRAYGLGLNKTAFFMGKNKTIEEVVESYRKSIDTLQEEFTDVA